jgi:hypothetical protein
LDADSTEFEPTDGGSGALPEGMRRESKEIPSADTKFSIVTVFLLTRDKLHASTI